MEVVVELESVIGSSVSISATTGSIIRKGGDETGDGSGEDVGSAVTVVGSVTGTGDNTGGGTKDSTEDDTGDDTGNGAEGIIDDVGAVTST